ncbi:MAG: RNA polymerase subunit sigma [Bacteroidetes bacterium GWF2_41_31]|nr:MAG: RNA polymerase subunit sigma [Bacteroidetes bacterium GWF2_41_31]PIQ32345.1 MAG: RNA polymerase subunit sigma [Bacteroidetes bacterium CG18_big_fil_WC_8_21_14_2_50_41_14]PJB58341.1 MAG: RNA polymerase subunit sigma [Bacteroidetes bacterium CG_4_9_14_3_um_filter_41_19]
MRQLKISKSITNRNTASLDKYLQDIGKEELITAEEEVDLARRIKTGDRIALEKLTKANLRFVVSVSKQYQNQGLSLQDMINEGNLGLIKAAQRFDETRGFKFISYAVWWIRQSILQALAEQSRIVRLPLNQVGSLNKIKKTTSRLEQKYERMPSESEIAQEMEVADHKINSAMKIATKYVSMDAPLGEEDDTSFLDMYIPRDAEETDESLMRESLGSEIQRSLASLSDKERDVINMYYGIGMNHGFTLEEIGDKFDLTRERVRQIKEKAIRRLRHTARSRLLKAYLGQ